MSNHNYDPFGYVSDLREAWEDKDLHTNEVDARTESFRLALAQGRCLLYGIQGDTKLFRNLPQQTVIRATEELLLRLQIQIAKAECLRYQWTELNHLSEADELAARALKFRMDLWGITIAIDRVYFTTPTEELGHAIDQINDAIDRYDTILQMHQDIFATITGTRLLDNWRGMLAPEYREFLPWWIDGRLEAIAQKHKI